MRDVFGTAAIREQVLQAWAASPARFREDANTEEDYALGGYRNRLIVELAQNAADAASRAGVPGELVLDWDGTTLRAANTGAPLDRDGVIALASLRASAKDAGTVGRFGVGFSAVLSVTDEPRILSRTGGIGFSADRTRAEIERVAALSAEVQRRSGQVPVLRLPWPTDGEPLPGCVTEVQLPVRPELRERIPGLLAEVTAEILLGLPALHRIRIGDRILRRTGSGDEIVLYDGAESATWRVSTVDGGIPPELLADRPTEERRRDRWQLTWAVPVDPDGHALRPPGPAVLHAPTPSTQPVSVPARLIATIPLDPDRRHVAEGPLTDYLVGQAGVHYPRLVESLPSGPQRLRLVPEPRLSTDAVDAALVRAAVDALRSAPVLSTVDSSRLTVLERDVAAAAPVLVDVIDGLLAAEWSAVAYEPALRTLGVRRLSAVDIIEIVSTVERPPEWWHRLYAGVQDAADRDALAALPVPLTDGRTVTGARGAFLVQERIPAGAMDALGLRVVDPAAAHPLLERLGARTATPRSLLEEESVRAAVEESYDAEDPEPIAAAVLALVEAAELPAGTLPWLSELALPGSDGEWYPAGEMVLPGSPLDRVVAADAPYGRPDPDWVRRWGAPVLAAAGVLATFPVLRSAEVVLGEPELDLPDEPAWHEAVEARLPPLDLPVTLTDFAAAGDLDLVADWPGALDLLAAEPLRSLISAPTVAALPDGGQAEVPSYTAWWLATHPVLDGRRPDGLALPTATELRGLYDEAGVDPDLARLVGVRAGLAEVLADPDGAIGLLHRLADPRRTADPAILPGLYGRIAQVLRDFDVDPPRAVRVAPERVVPTEAVVVLDVPYALPLLDDVPVGGGPDPEAVATLLQAPLASAILDARVTSAAESVRPWSAVPGAESAARRCGAAVPDADVAVHRGLRIGNRPARWWPQSDVDHVDSEAGAGALGRALAWRLGRWDRRAAAAEAFAHPDADWPGLEDSLE